MLKIMDESKKSQIAQREERILDFWNKELIFKKSLEKESPKGNFVFYDGPPFATGLPHFGHVLPGTMKDVIPRFKTMQGYHVLRRWGWDCHGLPIENLVEKELGLATKKDIEVYGIEKFNEAARATVFRYRDQWKKIVARLGRFVEMDDDYRTLDPSYTESVWWAWKSLYEKNLAYESYKIMPYCPRCGTTLSNFEVNQGYKDITDISVYVAFKLIDTPNTFLIAWTTTPWTLPGNVALAINPDEQYTVIEFENNHYIVLASKIEKIFKDKKYTVINTSTKGSDLVGKKYEPVFDYYKNESLLPAVTKESRSKMWQVYAADFVTTEDGSGIVHIAPGFGDDDYQLAQTVGLPPILHIKEDGSFKSEIKDFAGLQAKPKEDSQKTDVEIIKHLARTGSLFAKEKIIHSYPHCWRCETPLLNYATSSWFIKVTSLKEKLIEENKKVTWVPEEIGAARFGKWLEGARDWAVSRSRFWGAPLPVWKSEDGFEIEVIGSLEELKKKTDRKNTFVLMRHGQGEHNVSNTLSSIPTYPHHLTDRGKEQVKEVVAQLLKKKIDLIYTSDFVRTKETAQLVAKALGYPEEKIIVDTRLREIDFGTLNGESISVYHEMFPSYESCFEKKIPGGESMYDVRARIGGFAYDIDAQHEGKNILVISHETALWMFVAIAQSLSEKNIISMRKDGGEFIRNAEIREVPFVSVPHNAQYQIDFHRPYIDKVVWKSVSGKTMKRIPAIFDTWFDSGSMPYAQNHYPFSNKSEFEKKDSTLFPADFIAEGLDQTRGWFYTLLVLSTALFGKSPYKNVVVNGLVLAEDGKKMSKSLKNYPDMMETINVYGADALRYFLISSPAVKSEDIRFSEKALDEVVKKNIQRLDNVCVFYEMYKQYVPVGSLYDPTALATSPLDMWIVSRLEEVRGAMTKHLELYEFDKASRPISDFIDDLSTWYVRRSRDRYKSNDVKDREQALLVSGFVLKQFSKLLAPFMPFIAEDIYQRVRYSNDKQSVHLELWPEAFVDIIATTTQHVLVDMKAVREIVSLGLEARVRAGIKVRQPLSVLSIKLPLDEKYIELIKDEINVKSVNINLHQKDHVVLDTIITPNLKMEGDMRDILRVIQDKRKEMDLIPGQMAIARIPKTIEYEMLLDIFEKNIKATASLKEIIREERADIVLEKI